MFWQQAYATWHTSSLYGLVKDTPYGGCAGVPASLILRVPHGKGGTLTSFSALLQEGAWQGWGEEIEEKYPN